jgi:hypothetical protein
MQVLLLPVPDGVVPLAHEYVVSGVAVVVVVVMQVVPDSLPPLGQL